ncbi:MAG: TlpA family protein disulfide reductase [Bacteroidales bacterium]|jgi:thiol-disulfide isomerase/thioredoxin|nr:TlpA family protein disulfide reductase [Bacteroidales bacterium]
MAKVSKNILLFFLFSTLFLGVDAQINIRGSANFAAGKELRIETYDDLLSKKKNLIHSSIIDDKGNFDFSLNLRYPSLLFFSINFLSGEIILEPHKNYLLELSVDTIYQNPLEISIHEVPLWIEIVEPKGIQLMGALVQLEEFIETFLGQEQRFNRLVFARDYTVYDSLVNIINENFKSYDNNYFNIYKRYKVAQVEKIMYSKMTERLYDKFFTGHEIYYNNIAYMQFFDDFFKRYIQSPNSKIPKERLYELINERFDYFELEDFLGKDPILVNEQIRELVLLKNLAELYKTQHFNKSNILKYIYHIEQNSKFPEHKIIAKNMILDLAKLESGYKPEINIAYTTKGDTVFLDKYRGKPLFIHLFTTDCLDCVKEMFAIQKLRKDFEGKINFVSISLDANSVKLFHFINSRPQFDWEILSFGNNYQWIKEYGIQSLPLNILLDEKGEILLYPSPDPSGELSRFLYQYFMEDYRPQPLEIPGSEGYKRKIKN